MVDIVVLHWKNDRGLGITPFSRRMNNERGQMNVRQRAGKQASSQAKELFLVAHDDYESDHYRRQKTLHTGILSRFFWIIGIFASLSIVFSRRKHDIYIRAGSLDRSDRNDSSRGNTRDLGENPRVVTIVMPR